MSEPFDLADPVPLRQAIRCGAHRGFTNGLAPGYAQGNLAIVPQRWAADFYGYCHRNPRCCPLLGVSEPGRPHIPELARDLDLRTDIGEYRVYRDGVLVDTPTDISALWQDDLVAFVLGCSFSFEDALIDAGLSLRHIAEGNVSAMYVTSLDTQPSGAFAGRLVVSMRPFRPADAIQAIQITSRYPKFHGAPVHIGKPELIGVDLAQPYGGHGLTQLHDDELPLFWACGATPQIALEAARLPLAITHSKAHMVVTDLKSRDFAAP